MKWETQRLRVHVWMEEGGIWIAHCLECDAFAEAGSFSKVMQNLAAVVWEAIQHARDQGFDPFGLPAPSAVIDSFDEFMRANRPTDMDTSEPPDDVRNLLVAWTLQVPTFAQDQPNWVGELTLPPPHIAAALGRSGSLPSVFSSGS